MPSAGSSHRRKVRLRLWRLQGRRCFYCGGAVGRRTVTLDHLIPRVLFRIVLPTDAPREYMKVAACHACNVRKGDRPPTAEELARWSKLHGGDV